MQIVDVRSEIVIEQPVQKVADYACDPDNATKWYANIRSVTWQTPKPLRVGSLLAFRAKFLGRELSYVYEVAEHSPGRKFVMRTADGPFPMETTYEFEDLGGKTRMRLINAGVPSGFFALFAPFMSAMMRSANKKDLIMLKRVLESDSR